jgi:hypothetical protein
MMKSKQKGEVMLAMMAVMLVVVWLANGHMGMMGHGSGAAEKPVAAEQPDVVRHNAAVEQKR